MCAYLGNLIDFYSVFLHLSWDVEYGCFFSTTYDSLDCLVDNLILLLIKAILCENILHLIVCSIAHKESAENGSLYILIVG